MYLFDPTVIQEYMPNLIDGIKITVFISVISSVIAFFIGIMVVFFRTMGRPFVRFFAASYVEIIRNTPLLIQLYFIYMCLPAVGLKIPPIICGILGLSLYTGAFISEVLRSGINSVATEQYLASLSLGFRKFQAFRMIIFPQALRIVIPAMGSQFINTIKNSSLVSFISVADLYYNVEKLAVDDFRVLEAFVAGAVLYMIITGIVAIIANIAEHLFNNPVRLKFFTSLFMPDKAAKV
jgi:His/Glu/Gln/Arg/opine family amino acid ABC transporter permease subunit